MNFWEHSLVTMVLLPPWPASPLTISRICFLRTHHQDLKPEISMEKASSRPRDYDPVSITISPNRLGIATASSDSEVIVWNITAGYLRMICYIPCDGSSGCASCQITVILLQPRWTGLSKSWTLKVRVARRSSKLMVVKSIGGIITNRSVDSSRLF